MYARWYEGKRTAEGCVVYRCSGTSIDKLPLRLETWNHSPTGFEWGYGGSGPAQLALALLVDALQNEAAAIELHQTFKWEVITQLAKKEWKLTAREISDWCARHDQELADLQPTPSADDGPIDLSDDAHAALLRRESQHVGN